MPQKVSILPSGRLGYPVSINRSDRPVFVDPNGARMCMHGEKAHTIRTWTAAERAHEPGFTRTSACTCCNADGLLSARPAAPCDVPATNNGLYGLLGALGAPEKEIDSRPQRLALKTADAELWVQPSDMVVCEHGNSRKILNKLREQREGCSPQDPPIHFRSKRVVRCECVIRVPRRHGSVFGDALNVKGRRVRARANGPEADADGRVVPRS